MGHTRDNENQLQIFNCCSCRYLFMVLRRRLARGAHAGCSAKPDGERLPQRLESRIANTPTKSDQERLLLSWSSDSPRHAAVRIQTARRAGG